MAFPVVQSLTPTAVDTAATSHLIAMPATVGSGDLLVVLFASNGTPTVTTPTSPAFTALHSTASGSRNASYYRIADGSEGGTTVDFVTSASHKAIGHVYRITGWHGTTPPEVGTPTTGATTTPDPPSLSPSWGAEDTLWLVEFSLSGVRTVSDWPDNYTDTTLTNSTSGSAICLASARRELNTATEDPTTFTQSASGSTVAETLAIRPAAAGGATVDPFPYVGGGYYPTEG